MPVSCPICKKQFDTENGVSIHYGKMHDISETRSTDTDRSTSKRNKASGSQVKGRAVTSNPNKDDRGFPKSLNKDGSAGSAVTSKSHKDDRRFPKSQNTDGRTGSAVTSKPHYGDRGFSKSPIKDGHSGSASTVKCHTDDVEFSKNPNKYRRADKHNKEIETKDSGKYEDTGRCRQKSTSVLDGKAPEGKYEDTGRCRQKSASVRDGKAPEADSEINSVRNRRSARMRLREDVDSIRLTKKDVSTASEVVNDFIDEFKAKLTETSSLTFDLLRSGSYYDKTKNSAPDEFDYMFYPRSVRVRVNFRESPPGYCKLEILNIPDDLKFRVESDRYLDPSKYKKYIFHIFDKILADKSFRPGRKLSKKERPGDSPAYTVLYTAIPGKVLDIDLVPCIQIEEWPIVAEAINPTWTKDDKMIADCMKCYHVVCKTCPDDIPGADMMWRMSFSWAEKILIKFANMGNEKSYRKSIFRCLKAVLEDTKNKNPDEIHKFCSYHLKMFMLMQFDDPKYQCGDADEVTLTLHAIQQLQIALREDKSRGYPKIQNYFIPSDNVVRAVPKRELELVRIGLQNKYDYLQKR